MPKLRRGAQALPRLPPREAPPSAAPGSPGSSQSPRFTPVAEGSAGAAQLHVAFGFRPCSEDAIVEVPSLEQQGQPTAVAQQSAISLVGTSERPLGPAPRRDHHTIQPYSRGSKATAIAIAGDPAARERAKTSRRGQAHTAGSNTQAGH